MSGSGAKIGLAVIVATLSSIPLAPIQAHTVLLAEAAGVTSLGQVAYRSVTTIRRHSRVTILVSASPFSARHTKTVISKYINRSPRLG